MSNDDAFSDLYEPLRRFAAVVGPAGCDPDDLVQDALARVLARGGLDRVDHPLAYLRTAVLRLAVDEGRRGARARRVAARLGPTGAASDGLPSDLHDLLRLDARERAVLYLRVIERMSFAEVADALGITPVAARARASRGLRRLRLELAEELRDG